MARTAKAVSSKAELTHPSTEVIVVNGVPVTTRSTGSGDPVILLNRFRGTLDTWDPAFVAALASRHRVVMFDSLGIGETGGHTPALAAEGRQIVPSGHKAPSGTNWSRLGAKWLRQANARSPTARVPPGADAGPR